MLPVCSMQETKRCTQESNREHTGNSGEVYKRQGTARKHTGETFKVRLSR